MWTPSPDARPDTADATGRRVLPLQDAARELGVSRDALRKRLDRGSLRGFKKRGTWYVYLDAADAMPDAERTPPTGRVDAIPDRQADTTDAIRTPLDATPDADPGVSRELVDVLKAQVADLQGRLDASQQAESELRRLLMVALQQHALPAPREPPADLPGAGKLSASGQFVLRPWWERLAWWRH